MKTHKAGCIYCYTCKLEIECDYCKEYEKLKKDIMSNKGTGEIMITKITEQQAREIMFGLDENVVDGQIRYLKGKGYIKKSAKEEFEEYIFKCKEPGVLYNLNDIVDLARTAIEEEYQRGFENGRNSIIDGCKAKEL